MFISKLKENNLNSNHLKSPVHISLIHSQMYNIIFACQVSDSLTLTGIYPLAG